MAVDIDTLQIEIEANANEAVSGIDKLAETLGKLKNAVKGGVGLNTTSKQMQALVDATKGATSASNKIGKLASALTSLSTVQKSPGLASAANTLSKFKDLDLSGVSTEKMQTLASSLNTLGSVQKASGLMSTVNALKKLPEISKSLETADLGKFATQMKQVASAMAPLANEMQKVSNGFAAFPIRIQKIIASNAGLTASNQKAAKSFNLFGSGIAGAISKLTIWGFGISRVISAMGSMVTASNDYVENINLFQVSMGGFYQEAFDYAQLVSNKLGVDPSEWMRNQGVFMSMAKGFGVANDQAYALSKGLTELSYDISSLYNEDIATSMQRLQSAIAGEIEPVRRWGFALSQASLEETALRYGISESVQSMTEAEKALLRNIALLEQAKRIGAVGDFARTLESPANALRVLNQQITQFKRAIGSVMIPIIMQVLPWIQAVVELLTEWIRNLAVLVGFTMPEWDTKAWESSGGIASDTVDEVTNSVKELKKATLGIDELNIISPNTGAGNIPDNGLSDWAANLEIPGVWDEKMLKEIQTKVGEIKEKLEPILDIVVGIGTAFLAWKVSEGLLRAIDYIKNLSFKKLIFSIEFKALGFAMFLADIKEFLKYFDDFKENGANFHNIAGMISEFVGMVGDALIILGNLELGGALKIVQGIGEIIVAIEDISKNGVDWDNAYTAIRGLTNIAIGIGLLTGNIKLAGWAVAIQGLISIVKEIAENWEAIKQGDWSGVDKVALIIGAIEILGGLVVALDVFSRLKGISSIGNATQAVQAATDATGSIAGATGGLSPNLSSLAKNLGLGVAIIAEIAASAIIFVGAIAIIGYELEEVGKAWEPVINNGPTIAIAIGTGTGILVAVGLATYGLGTLGATAAINIGIGTGILAELGIATGLFLIEIWAIGKGLDEIGKAWQPVLENGETISTGIGLGTALLVGIGVVTAALGAASIATGLALPAAIGLGTAILVELAAAFVLFTESLVAVADELSNKLEPSLSGLNKKLPSLEKNMSNFVDYMTLFAGEVSSYTSSMGNITWSSIANGFQKLFAGNPIQSLANDVTTITTDTSNLNDELRLANPELQTAVTLLTDYSELMSQLKILTEENGTINLATGIFTNLKVAGKNLVTGFSSGITENTAIANEAAMKLGTDTMSGLEAGIKNNTFLVTNAMKSVMETVDVNTVPIANSTGQSLSVAIISGADSEIRSRAGELGNIGKFVGEGIAKGLQNAKIDSAISGFTSNLLSRTRKSANINSPSKLFRDEVGIYLGLGIAEGLSDSTRPILNEANGIMDTLSGAFSGIAFNIPTSFSIKNAKIPNLPNMQQQVQVPNHAIPQFTPAGNPQEVESDGEAVSGIYAGVASANQEVINAILAAAQQIVGAVESSGGDFYLDAEKVGTRTTSIQNRQNRMYGKTLQNT